MRGKKFLLLAAVSALALMVTSTNAAYRCIWTDGVKVCGNEFGFAPSAGGESDKCDQHSGDHESGSADASGSSGGDSGSSGDLDDFQNHWLNNTTAFPRTWSHRL